METSVLFAQHCHSHYSRDGESALSAVVEKAKQRGIHVLFMTEHAEDLDEKLWRQFTQECHQYSQGISICPGLEFRTQEGLHLLGLNLKNYQNIKTCTLACTFIREQGGFSIIAHPHYYPFLLESPCFDFSEVDAIEVWTAKADSQRCPRKSVLRLYQHLKKTFPYLRAVAGLDAHGTYMVSTPIMRTVSATPTKEDPVLVALHALRENSYTLSGGKVLLNAQGEILKGRFRINLIHPFFKLKKILQRFAKRWRKLGFPELHWIRKLFRKVF
jgi:hypothetical protein